MDDLQLGNHHWAANAITDCIAQGIRQTRGTDCCSACREHHEIDMGWLKHKEMNRKPGTPGVFIILADATGSISPVNKRRIRDEAEQILRQHPGAKLWAFGTSVCDITNDPSRLNSSIYECFAGLDLDKDQLHGTYIGRALAEAAKLNPERVAVLSDGGTEDRSLLLRTADSMTGTIDAYYCHPRREEYQLEHYFISADEMWRRYSRGANKGLMQELARRGGGRFSDYPSRDGIYTDFGIREATPMAYERKVFMTGPAVNIQAPQGEVHRVVRRIDVYHDTEIHHHHGETSHVHHGEPGSVDIEAGRAQVSVSRPDGLHIEHHEAPAPSRSLLRTLFLGPARVKDRGELKEAPALQGPSEQPMQIAYFGKQKVS